jgi:8-amino-7-oxononanoate synthase
MCRSFAHNDVDALSATLRALRDEHAALREGTSSVIVAVESVYSMNGSVAPLRAMLDTIDEVFPAGNAHMVVDEAHGTGVFGPGGRGLVALLGVEDRVLARLHTFGKALAASGAVILSSTLIRDYLFNYARSLTYTTALSNTAVVSASCSFDLLEDGTTERLAAQVLGHSAYFQEHLRASLAAWSIPLHILALPVYLKQHPSIAQPLTPIVPLLTPRSQDLALHLRAHRFNVRSLSFPIVQKGTDRVRVCLHASNTRAEIDALVNACMAWAAGIVLEERAGPEADGARIGGSVSGMRPDGRNLLGSKL